MELIWILLAVLLGWLLLKFLGGHGGIQVSRANLGGLPPDGQLKVRGSEVRWTSAESGSFAAAWPLPSGHWVAIRVRFEPADDVDEDDDQGYLDLTVSDREITTGATWTDDISDRGLRADVEMVLEALAQHARQSRSDKTRAAAAKRVGIRKGLD